ncbi:MAG: MBL fold metallo-hydrolase [Thermomicrobiales bacterium]|jgi:glyoxylase-like metal-dependent hydrolase (beta-lactamase superfamily II)|nr:MBL fold metallo-hydrolase [Thermomicrobiales bacterium]
MPDDSLLYTVTVGDARIALIRDGELDIAAAELFNGTAPDALVNQPPDAGDGLVTIPLHVALVQVDDEVVLIDTGLGTIPAAGERGGQIGAALGALGLTPDAVTRVIITHMHGDHIGGVFNDAGQLAFPRARYHLPRADWEWAAGHEKEKYPRFVRQLASLTDPVLDAPDDRLTPSLRSVDSAGHSPGHRCLLVESSGQGFCFLGDLTHLPSLHFTEPDRVTAWDSDPTLTPPARRRVAAQAVAGDWLLAAPHAGFPALGRLTPAAGAWAWQSVE